jgi:hypothetical protein
MNIVAMEGRDERQAREIYGADRISNAGVVGCEIWTVEAQAEEAERAVAVWNRAS